MSHQILLFLKWNLTVAGEVKDQKVKVKRKKKTTLKTWKQMAVIFDNWFTALRLTRLGFLDCVLRTILFSLSASLPHIWISHEKDGACLCWSWIHVCLWSPFQVSVTSRSFAKTAATYVALLRDLLSRASLFPPTTLGEHAHAAWLASCFHCTVHAGGVSGPD